MACLMFSLMFPASLLYSGQRLIALCYFMVGETWKIQGETERSKKEHMREDFEHQDRFHLVIVPSTHLSGYHRAIPLPTAVTCSFVSVLHSIISTVTRA